MHEARSTALHHRWGWIVGGVALVLATAAYLRPPAPAEPTAAAGEGLVAFGQRLDALEAIWQNAPRAAPLTAGAGDRTLPAARSPVHPTRGAPPLDVDALAALRQRVERLEQQLQRLPEAALFTLTNPRDEPAADAANSIAAWRAQAVDGALPENERLRALRALRSLGPGARGEPVLSAMVALAQTSADGSMRADVWRQMSGANEPGLVAPLIHAVLHDRDVKTREEAAETLGDYIGSHPEALATLRQVAAGDADEGVREEAEKSMRSAGR